MRASKLVLLFGALSAAYVGPQTAHGATHLTRRHLSAHSTGAAAELEAEQQAVTATEGSWLDDLGFFETIIYSPAILFYAPGKAVHNAYKLRNCEGKCHTKASMTFEEVQQCRCSRLKCYADADVSPKHKDAFTCLDQVYGDDAYVRQLLGGEGGVSAWDPMHSAGISYLNYICRDWFGESKAKIDKGVEDLHLIRDSQTADDRAGHEAPELCGEERLAHIVLGVVEGVQTHKNECVVQGRGKKGYCGNAKEMCAHSIVPQALARVSTHTCSGH